MSAYYPLVLSGSSLIVCFWAEVFHLREIRWDRPRFLSKSFLGFLAFNVITYSLLTAELLLVWIRGAGKGEESGHRDRDGVGGDDDDDEYFTHIFNGCYAVLMFVVVVFFLIYGVEVFFKVRGGFTVPRVPGMIASARSMPREERRKHRKHRRRRREQQDGISDGEGEEQEKEEEVVAPAEIEQLKPLEAGDASAAAAQSRQEFVGDGEAVRSDRTRASLVPLRVMTLWSFFFLIQLSLKRPCSSSPSSPGVRIEDINTSQLHQSRLGLLSQAVMMMVTVGFLFSETLEQFWKTK